MSDLYYVISNVCWESKLGFPFLGYSEFCFSHYLTRMSSITGIDIFSEVRKYRSSSDAVKADNYAVLISVEESIMKKKGIKRESITPVNYFFAIMTLLNTRTTKYRSV